LVDETGFDEPKVDVTVVDKIAVDEAGPHQLAYVNVIAHNHIHGHDIYRHLTHADILNCM